MDKLCMFDGCGRKHYAKGLCNGHWRQQWLGKDLSPLVDRSLTDRQRFWQNVDKSAGCWEWKRWRNDDGYGWFRLGGRMKPAHRVSWEFLVGPIPKGALLDHTCWNPPCVNPEHLRIADRQMNGQNRKGAYGASGVRGVYWYEHSKRWAAKAGLDYKQHHIGYFDTIEEADRAVTEWRRQNMPNSLADQMTRAGSFFMPKTKGEPGCSVTAADDWMTVGVTNLHHLTALGRSTTTDAATRPTPHKC